MSTAKQLTAWRNLSLISLMWDEEGYFNHESILVVTEKGRLKRLKTPFKVILLVELDHLKKDEIYLVSAVITNAQDIMVYAIGAHSYFYYWFVIL